MARTETARPTGGDQSLGDLVALAAKDVSQLVRCEMDLAKAELRGDLRRAGLAGALFGIAAFVGCLLLVMLCFAFAYGLMTIGIWSWAAFLVVGGACVLLIGLAAVVAALRIRGVTGLRGTRRSVSESVAMLRHGGERHRAPGQQAPAVAGEDTPSLPAGGHPASGQDARQR